MSDEALDDLVTAANEDWLVMYWTLRTLKDNNVVDIDDIASIYGNNMGQYDQFTHKLRTSEWDLSPQDLSNTRISQDLLLSNPEFKASLRAHINLIKDAIPPEMFAEIVGHQITERKPGFVDIDLATEALGVQSRMLDALQGIPSVEVAGKHSGSNKSKEEKKKKKKEKEKKKKKHEKRPLLDPKIGGAVLDI